MTDYGTVRCQECDQDLTNKTQVYDKGKVWCPECNYRVNKLKEVVKQRQD